jgi:hypothetical protein
MSEYGRIQARACPDLRFHSPIIPPFCDRRHSLLRFSVDTNQSEICFLVDALCFDERAAKKEPNPGSASRLLIAAICMPASSLCSLVTNTADMNCVGHANAVVCYVRFAALSRRTHETLTGFCVTKHGMC